MHLIYAYSGCSPKMYKELVESKGLRAQQQAQKYNQLLMEGFVANGATVDAVSSRPINRAVSKKLFFKSEKETQCGINYHYVPFVNHSLLRAVFVFFSTFFKILTLRKREHTALICDALGVSVAAAALLAAKIKRIKAVAIITDVPSHRPTGSKMSTSEKIDLYLMKKFDAYLLLTRHMNDVVNPKGRPFVVLEGHSDIRMKEVKNDLDKKYDKKVCFYAGSLRRIYGIGNLVDAFVKSNIENSELHIYGNGDYVEDLKELSKKYPNVKYMGIAPNDKIIEEELKCTLLVNPRPTNEEYTKYSFPSKNMEYMASGTPLLTTKLPGMPDEYCDYVYIIQEETVDGIKEKLCEILNSPVSSLHEKGQKAKDFVMNHKNNVVQAKKVLEIIFEKVL